jgi:hypothetical protein
LSRNSAGETGGAVIVPDTGNTEMVPLLAR